MPLPGSKTTTCLIPTVKVNSDFKPSHRGEPECSLITMIGCSLKEALTLEQLLRLQRTPHFKWNSYMRSIAKDAVGKVYYHTALVITWFLLLCDNFTRSRSNSKWSPVGTSRLEVPIVLFPVWLESKSVYTNFYVMNSFQTYKPFPIDEISR